MTRGEVASRWRYGVLAAGLAGAVALVALVAGSGDADPRDLAATGVPLGVYLLVVAFGVRLAGRESPRHVRTVAAVGVATAVGYVALSSWFFALAGPASGSPAGQGFGLVCFASASAGLAFGVVATHYYVREREQARALRATNAELRAQNERLDEFASILSHDIRNPLTVASGYTEIAIETGDVDHLDEVQACHRRIETLVDQVLALARMERDPDAIARVDVAGVATDALETVDVGDGEVVVDVDCTVEVERGDLRRVFENCYRNAVEHAGPDPTIRVVSLDDAPGFAVEDDGPGIPEDERDAVFERGYTNADGTGLGLAIVSEVAATYGWTVAVAEGRDGGARFEFRTGAVDDATVGRDATPDGDDATPPDADDPAVARASTPP